MTKFTPSPAQQRFYDWVSKETGNCILNAVAGAGKTTTLLNGIALMRGKVWFGVYNKKMADEIKAKMAERKDLVSRTQFSERLERVESSTFHSLGFGIVRNHAGKGVNVTVDDRKVKRIVESMILEKEAEGQCPRDDLRQIAGAVESLVSMAKNRGFVPSERVVEGLSDMRDFRAWNTMVEHFDLGESIPEGMEDVAIKFALSVLVRSNRDVASVDMDDMVYLPLALNVRLAPWHKFDWVLVDEAQDTNPTRRALARLVMAPRARLVAVGDPCQPEGTLVSVVDKPSKFHVSNARQVCIQDLRVGDFVESYSFKDAQRRYRAVTAIKQHPGSELITIEAGRFKSSYTPAHQCIVRYTKPTWLVYLMVRGRQARIGMSKAWLGSAGCGPMSRLRHEGGDALWILSVHNSRDVARVAEQRVQVLYGIPGTQWAATNQTLTQEQADSIWEGVDNYSKAAACLAAHERMLTHPYFLAFDVQATLRRPHVCFAANLLPGMEVKTDDGWREVKLTRSTDNRPVYSLTVEGEELYVADGILTHNCQAIFGFTGADNDALEQIADAFNAVQLPLTVSYRCPQSVVAHARNWVDHIQAHENAPMGSVSELAYQDLLDMLPGIERADYSEMAILCRYNKYLVGLCFKMIRMGLPAKIEGRNIGEGLVKLATRWKAVKTVNGLETKLREYQEREVAKALKNEQEQKADRITDEVATILVVIDRVREKGLDRVSDVVDAIEDIFADNVAGAGLITLCSAHKSKGLEWENVYLLDRASLMPSKFAKQEWQVDQEINLIYVAVTRAKVSLVEVTGVVEERDPTKEGK